MKEPVQAVKDSGGITASSCKSCCNRYLFIQDNMDALADVVVFPDQYGGLVYEVIFICGEVGQVRFNSYGGIVGPENGYLIIQAYGLHNHSNLVIAVLSFSDHIQTEINLCICFQLNGIHGYSFWCEV